MNSRSRSDPNGGPQFPRKNSIYRYIILLTIVTFALVNGLHLIVLRKMGNREEEQMMLKLLSKNSTVISKSKRREQMVQVKQDERLLEISEGATGEDESTSETQTQEQQNDNKVKEGEEEYGESKDENMRKVVVIGKSDQEEKGIESSESKTISKPSSNRTSNQSQGGLDPVLPVIGKKPKLKTHPGTYNCGCPHVCTKRSMSHGLAKFTCEARIGHLMKRYPIDEAEACRKATATNPEKPHEKPACPQECNPEICHDLKEVPTVDVSQMELPNPMHVRQEGVAIVTKVHQPADLDVLIQQICLFTAAYNRHVAYDIVVFTTLPWTKEQIEELQGHAWPAKLTVAVDISSPLEEQLAAMTQEEVEFLEKRCDVKEGETLSWMHHCTEEGSKHINNLAYSWQAEFRAYHIYNHPALKEYKYMLWLDTDSFCTRPWDDDPIKVMVENDLVLMYDMFPAGKTKGEEIRKKMQEGYGRVVCKIEEDLDEGHLIAVPCEPGPEPGKKARAGSIPFLSQVYGFHHITNLDFYREDIHQKFLSNLVGDYKFSRKWDDQLAVTLPAAMFAPERSWDMRSHNIDLHIYHNWQFDGKDNEPAPARNFQAYWTMEGGLKETWPVGKEMCDGLVVNKG